MSVVYQVLNWNDHFENNKSRERDKCSFICVPNKQDGMGLTRILSMRDGAAMYGIWALILGALSRQSKPREGWLTHDGTKDGTPWTVEDLALRWRLSESLVSKSLQAFCSQAVGWMVPVECPSGARVVPAECPRSEENRTEEKGSTSCAEADKPPSTPPVMILPVVGDGPKEFDVTQEMVDQWSEAYPGVDVLSELRKAKQWCADNPSRKKTHRGARKFLGGWLSRAQNNGGRGKGKAVDTTEADRKRAEQEQAKFAEIAKAKLEAARMSGDQKKIDEAFEYARIKGIDLGTDF